MGHSPHPALEALFDDPRTQTPIIALRPDEHTVAPPPGTEASAAMLRQAMAQLVEDAEANAWAIERVLSAMIENDAPRQSVNYALEAFQDLLEGQRPDPTQRRHAEMLLMEVKASAPDVNEQQAITALIAWLDGRRPAAPKRQLCEAFVEIIEDLWLEQGPPRALEAIIDTLDELQDKTAQTLVRALDGLIESVDSDDRDSGPTDLMHAGELLEGRGETGSLRALALCLEPEKETHYTEEDVGAIEFAPVVVLIPIDDNHVRFLCCRHWDYPHAADTFRALARSHLALTGASAYAALFQRCEAEEGEPNLYTLEYLHCNRTGVVFEHGEPLLCEGEPVGPTPLSDEAVDSLSRLLEPNGEVLTDDAGNPCALAPPLMTIVDLALN